MKVCNWLVLFLSISAGLAADKEEKFKPGPVDSYPHRVTAEKVTAAAEPFETAAKTKAPFGKAPLNARGVLPVLLVLRNDGDKVLRLDGMMVEYINQNRQRIESTPAHELAYLEGGKRPRMIENPIPTRAPRLGSRNSKLYTLDVQTRTFSARMLPPGDTVSGFYYFQTGFSSAAKIYITGIREAGSERELFYIEIPFQK